MSFTVAIDGPAAAGKGTISKAIAGRFGLAHLDTGLLYRAVASKTLLGVEPETAARALMAEDLKGDDLRTAEVAQEASRVAVFPQVRAALVNFQRAFAARDGGAVLDGRDIGTVICPDAPVKLFVTASAEARAERRWKELRDRGSDAELTEVLRSVTERDSRDRERSASPLKAAEDALVLDTTTLSIEEAIQAAIAHVAARIGQG